MRCGFAKYLIIVIDNQEYSFIRIVQEGRKILFQSI